VPAFTPDIRTLAFLLLAVGLLATAVFGGLWLQRRGDGAVGYWGLAHGLGAIGHMLVGLRGWIPDTLSIIVANTLLYAAAALLLKGIRRQLQQPFPDRTVWLFVAVLAVAYVHYTLVAPDLSMRVALWGVGGTILVGACAISLFSVPARERSGVHILTGLAFLAVALLEASAPSGSRPPTASCRPPPFKAPPSWWCCSGPSPGPSDCCG
jgi:hypothetical protein